MGPLPRTSLARRRVEWRKMKTWTKWVLVAVPGTILGMLLTSNGPIGNVLWPPAEGGAEPTSAQLPFLIGLDVVQSAAFGFGIAFLAFGFPIVKQSVRSSTLYAAAVFAAIAWGLVNWVPHIALHMAQGGLNESSQFWGLIGIDYGFHFTVLAGFGLLVHYVARVARGGSVAGTRTAMPAPTPPKGTAKARAR
jgi:hypothetical protein